MVKLREMKGDVKKSIKRFKQEHKIVFWVLFGLSLLIGAFSGLFGFILMLCVFVLTPYVYYKLLKWGVPPIFKGIEKFLENLFKVNKNG